MIVDEVVSGDVATDTLDAEDAQANLRKVANGRRFALATWHPDAGRVDAETFWLIWRDGANRMLEYSAAISPMLHTAAEMIVLMASARAAVPSDADVLAAAQRLLESEPTPLLEGWVAVSAYDLEALRQAIKGSNIV